MTLLFNNLKSYCSEMDVKYEDVIGKKVKIIEGFGKGEEGTIVAITEVLGGLVFYRVKLDQENWDKYCVVNWINLKLTEYVGKTIKEIPITKFLIEVPGNMECAEIIQDLEYAGWNPSKVKITKL